MNVEKLKPIIARGMYSILVYDGVILLTIFIMGNVFGEIYATEILLVISYFVIFTGLIGALGTLFLAIKTKEYKLIGMAFGYVGASGLVFVIILVLAIASINF